MVRLSAPIFWIILLMMQMSTPLAGDYDPLLLRAQASIYPKIMLLDKEIKKKTVNEEYVIKIVADANEQGGAQQLKSFIEEKYKSNLGEMTLNIQIITDDELHSGGLATAYIVMQVDNDTYQDVVAIASEKNRIVFGRF